MPQPNYRSILEKIAFSHSSSANVFADFCRIAACTLAAKTREEEYLETIRPYSKDQLSCFAEAFALLVSEMDQAPFTDCLGNYYLTVSGHASKQARGEFYTPQAISRLMANLSIDAKATIAKGSPITVNDPACGAGGMILAVAELFAPKHVDLLRVTCQDINPVAADMTFVNTTLWGIPSQIILGNSLSRKAPHKTWKNLHWHRVGEDDRLMLQHVRDVFMGWAPTSREDPKTFTPHSPIPREFDQTEFDLDLGMGSLARER